MSKLKQIFTDWRVILVIVCIIFSLVAISPNPGSEGVAIRSVVTNSSAANAGIEGPTENVRPMQREKVISINNVPIRNIEDYYEVTSSLTPNITITVETDEGIYKLVTKEKKEEVDNKTIITTEDIGLKVYDAPKTNIKKGLDLEGGTRVLLQPEEKISDEDMADLIDNMEKRLNVYGLTDIVLKEASDLSGNQYVLVEIAGANEEEVKELLAKQGKFEAKIGNETAFVGGNKDIPYVCNSADCAGIDPYSGCGKLQEGGYVCRFRFEIGLSPEAGRRHAEITDKLDIITDEDGNEYLSKKLDLYLDDVLTSSLSISSDLKGSDTTSISIQGSGVGVTQEEAMYDALNNMRRLQTILKTGSLPVKLTIAKTDVLSPALGEEFLKNAIYVGIAALLAVAAIIFVIYRKLAVAIPMALNGLIEVIIMLGVAALIGWNLDLAAIAGIIVAVGTGVDDLIVITDETIRGENAKIYDWKRKIKNAFFIIMAAFFTTAVAMTPLLFAGAGLLKGFALVTLIGISTGVLIVRPAYAKVVEILLK